MKPIRLKYASRSFKASRDDNGVPHIRAGNWDDALYGLGYLHAIDRPTQMLFSRTLAAGQAAERIADTPELVETDRFFRRVGLFVHLDREIVRLGEKAHTELTAYCDGVNDGLRQHGRSLPMWATGFQPRPWDVHGVMLICNLLNFGGLAIGQQQNERLILELIQAGIRPDLLVELFGTPVEGADFELLRRIQISHQLSDEALELIADLPRLSGSNAWAVAPSRSATGRALLASDPHLEVNRLPSVWHECVLEWNDQFLCGACLPGSPVFGVARNRHLSWGVTYLKGDTSDYFIEDCRQEGDRWQYRRENRWFDFDVRRETIRRKGGGEEQLDVWYNGLGTLEMNLAESEPGLCLSVAWTGAQDGAGRSLSTWLRMAHCRDTLSGMALIRELPQPTLNWVFADADGNIGMQASGWFPRRRAGHFGVLPVPAWDEANHWRGWLPSSKLPGVFNPSEGYVANANEDNNPPGGPLLITCPVPDYRKRRIDERLAQLDQATLEDMQQLQYDVISKQAEDLLAVFLPHLPDGPIKDRLAKWDGNYEPQSSEPTLFSLLYRNVLLVIFGHAEGGIGWRRMLYLCSRVGFSTMMVTAIDNLLHEHESGWWAGRDKGELIREAAEKLADDPLRDKPWSEINSFTITNRYFESRAIIGRAFGFHTGELPMRGCHATPFQGHLLRSAQRESSFAPSYHFVTDLGTTEAWTNLPGGPSESRFSRYYKIDLQRWLAGEYKRLSPGS